MRGAVLLLVLGSFGCAPRSQVVRAAPSATPSQAPGDTLHVARGHYLVAVWHSSRDECGEADLAFGRALLFDPGRPEVLLARGRSQLVCGETLEGEATLREAARLGATNAYGDLARSAWEAGRRMDAEGAVGEWVEATAVAPIDLAERGRWRVALGDVEGGLEDLAVGVPLDPDNDGAREALVAAAVELQAMRTLFDTLLATLEVQPSSRVLLQLTGDLAAELGDDLTARRVYERLDRLSGGAEGSVALDLALLALRTDDVDLAQGLLERTAGFPVHVQAGLLGLTGDLDSAAALIASGEEAARLALRMAELRHRQGDLPGARAELAALYENPGGLTPETIARIEARYVADDGGHEEALELLRPYETSRGAVALGVQLLMELDRPGEALSRAEEGLESWPESRLLAARRLEALEALGRTDEASAGALLLVETRPSRRPALLLSRNSEPSDAIAKVLDDCLEHHPGHGDVWVELAWVRWSLGDEAGASEALRRGLALPGRDSARSERYSSMCDKLACEPVDGGTP